MVESQIMEKPKKLVGEKPNKPIIMVMKVPVYIYARVSTKKLKEGEEEDERREFEQNPDIQLRLLRTFCAKRGYRIAGEYVDRVSGKSVRLTKRADFLQMIEDFESKNEAMGIVILDQDRYTREPLDAYMFLDRIVTQRHGFLEFVDRPQLKITRENINSEEVVMTFGLHSIISKVEREGISKRVKRGIADKKRETLAQGQRWHWGKKRMRVNMRMAVNLYSSGMSVRDIAKQLECSKSTVWIRLKRGGYI